MKRTTGIFLALLALATVALATLSVETPKTVLTSTGQTAFDFDFAIWDDDELVVRQNGTLKTKTTDYSVTFTAGDQTGGTVTFVSTVPAAQVVTMHRDSLGERTTDFPAAGRFSTTSLNTQLDRLIGADQDFDERFSRTVMFAPNSTATMTYLPDPEDAHVIGWDGQALINLDNSAAEAQLSAAAALASETAAAAYNTSAFAYNTSASAYNTSAAASATSAAAYNSSASATLTSVVHGDGTANREIRSFLLEMSWNGTGIAAATLPLFNAPNTTAATNLTKGGTDGSFSLDGTGSFCTIDLNNVVAPLSVSMTHFNTTGTTASVPYMAYATANSNDLRVSLNTPDAAIADFSTTIIGTGQVVYIMISYISSD
jgi:hypothetical protein